MENANNLTLLVNLDRLPVPGLVPMGRVALDDGPLPEAA